MRALVCKEYGSPDDLVVQEWDDPVPGENDIAFEVRAAALNFADVLAVAGQYQVRAKPPFIPGNEASGVVTAVGSKVTTFRPGDRIIAALRGGAFAEKSVIDARYAIHLPESMGFEEGAAYSIAYGTGYHALKQGANLRAGETVLVLGAAGGVGHAAVELARAMGAEVIAAASSDEKLSFAAEAGANHLVDYSNGDLRAALRELGDGVDVVYDPVGGDLAMQAVRALAWHGRYIVVGFASGEIPSFPLNLPLLKEAAIVGTWYGTWAEKHPEEMLQNTAELAEFVAAGRIKPRYGAAFMLDDFAEAFRLITQRRALGKVVLRMNAGS
ncbi:MAG: NADPH:quinone oxidoreductase family protein [Gammaproteobacteria bacterium]|nr:NADPH:quinone oxidoreductase family protein [Gammaproteobacteria bacterium]NNL64262.1 NADPH:quinone oxidoreductase family protein [Woeseiaceae bacterium]